MSGTAWQRSMRPLMPAGIPISALPGIGATPCGRPKVAPVTPALSRCLTVLLSGLTAFSEPFAPFLAQSRQPHGPTFAAGLLLAVGVDINFDAVAAINAVAAAQLRVGRGRQSQRCDGNYGCRNDGFAAVIYRVQYLFH